MIASVFGPKRTASIPKFEIWKLEEDALKGSVATPPPDRNSYKLFYQIGKYVICLTYKKQKLQCKTFPWGLHTSRQNESSSEYAV